MKILILNDRLFKKQLTKIPSDIRVLILKKIQGLSAFPKCDFSVRKLRNLDLADYRIRVGDYRVLFNVDRDHRQVIIIGVLHRRESYRQ